MVHTSAKLSSLRLDSNQPIHWKLENMPEQQLEGYKLDIRPVPKSRFQLSYFSHIWEKSAAHLHHIPVRSSNLPTGVQYSASAGLSSITAPKLQVTTIGESCAPGKYAATATLSKEYKPSQTFWQSTKRMVGTLLKK